MNYLSQTQFVAHPFEQEEEILPGVKWGRAEWVPSPAYWAALAACQLEQPLFRKPDSLAEEIGFCLLGGYGITAELNCAAFQHLKSHGVFKLPSVEKPSAIEKLLRADLLVGASTLHYRLPRRR